MFIANNLEAKFIIIQSIDDNLDNNIFENFDVSNGFTIPIFLFKSRDFQKLIEIKESAWHNELILFIKNQVVLKEVNQIHFWYQTNSTESISLQFLKKLKDF